MTKLIMDVPEFLPRISKNTSVTFFPNGVTRGIVRLELDGEPLPAAEKTVPLKDDWREHVVKVEM